MPEIVMGMSTACSRPAVLQHLMYTRARAGALRIRFTTCRSASLRAGNSCSE